VDREFYVMQGEIYTQGAFGQKGHQEFSVDKLLNERPEYFVLNGAVDSLTTQHPLQAKMSETVRIFYGVGGPNLTSSFHVIGEIFDRVYNQASLTSAPLTDVQTAKPHNLPVLSHLFSDSTPQTPNTHRGDYQHFESLGILGITM
jgi:nitrite reductase (NO-forming)